MCYPYFNRDYALEFCQESLKRNRDELVVRPWFLFPWALLRR